MVVSCVINTSEPILDRRRRPYTGGGKNFQRDTAIFKEILILFLPFFVSGGRMIAVPENGAQAEEGAGERAHL